MKITEIIENGNIFIITKTPNFIERLFGIKVKKKEYKDTGDVYHYFPNIHVYVNKSGKILGPAHKITKKLENYRRSF